MVYSVYLLCVCTYTYALTYTYADNKSVIYLFLFFIFITYILFFYAIASRIDFIRHIRMCVLLKYSNTTILLLCNA